MAYFEVARPATGSLRRLVQNLITEFHNWKMARETRAALSSLSDHELKDIGLLRADLDKM